MNTMLTDPPGAARGATRRPRWWIVAVLVLIGILAGGAVGYALAGSGDQPAAAMATEDQATTARASQVMGFDLDATTHTFTQATDGGVEQVVANDPADNTNIGLIRTHLQAVAAEFSAGDYSEPATIHGADMPGLAELQAGASRVQVGYEETPAGARIVYRSADPVLVAALHAWFDAQNSDHAMPGMGMGH